MSVCTVGTIMYLSTYVYAKLINKENTKYFLFFLNLSLDLFHYSKVFKRGYPSKRKIKKERKKEYLFISFVRYIVIGKQTAQCEHSGTIWYAVGT